MMNKIKWRFLKSPYKYQLVRAYYIGSEGNKDSLDFYDFSFNIHNSESNEAHLWNRSDALYTRFKVNEAVKEVYDTHSFLPNDFPDMSNEDYLILYYKLKKNYEKRILTSLPSKSHSVFSIKL